MRNCTTAPSPQVLPLGVRVPLPIQFPVSPTWHGDLGTLVGRPQGKEGQDSQCPGASWGPTPYPGLLEKGGLSADGRLGCIAPGRAILGVTASGLGLTWGQGCRVRKE